ncbi:MAG: MFS transporter [Acidimicrobiia bacterium]
MRNRRIRTLFAAELVSRVGSWMSTLVIGFLAFDETGSAFWAAAVAASYAIPSAVFSLPAGAIAGRMSPRRLVFISQMGSFVTISVLAVAAVVGGALLPWLVAMGVLSGIFSAFTFVAWQEVIHEVATSDDELMTAVSTNSTLTNVARLGGPPVGGLVFVQFGAAAVFFVDAASFLPVLAVLGLIPAVVRPNASDDASRRTSLRDALGVARAHPTLRWTLLLVAVAGVLAGPLSWLLAPLARDLGHHGAHELGLLMGCFAVGSVAELAVVSQTGRRIRISDMVRISYFLMCVVLLVLGAEFVLVVVAALLVVYGLARTAGRSVLLTAVHMAAPDRYRDRLIGVYGFLDTSLTIIAALTWGLVADAIGMTTTTAVAGALLLVAVTAFAFRNKFGNLDPPEIAALPRHLHPLDWEHQAWRLTRGVHRRAGQSATRQPV